MISSFRVLLLLGIYAATPLFAADTLRVMTYNALNFRGTQDMSRTDEFRRIVRSVAPDVACMQEIISEEAVDVLLSFAYLTINDDWASAQFMNGPDTDNAFFYRTSKVRFISQRAIHTSLRDIQEYVFESINYDSTERIYFYSAHLKASQGADNEERRRVECVTLRQQLDLHPPGSHFMFMGDCNFYGASEPGYQVLLSPTPNINGQLFDPIDMPGEWNNSAGFAPIHTQSPRSDDLGDGGATGGLDDRFDFILVSAAWMDEQAMYALPQTYHAHGNDGLHFNQSVNYGNNLAVPDSVADALHLASDHLPVVMDFVVQETELLADFPPPVIRSFQLLTCYPNPFNPVLTVRVNHELLGRIRDSDALLSAHDMLGRRLFERVLRPGDTSSSEIQLDFSNYAAGAYMIRMIAAGVAESQTVRFVK